MRKLKFQFYNKLQKKGTYLYFKHKKYINMYYITYEFKHLYLKKKQMIYWNYVNKKSTLIFW